MERSPRSLWHAAAAAATAVLGDISTNLDILTNEENKKGMNKKDTGTSSSSSSLDANWIKSLDLAPIIEAIAAHAATRRGQQALFSLIMSESDDPLIRSRRLRPTSTAGAYPPMTAQKRRAMQVATTASKSTSSGNGPLQRRRPLLIRLSSSIEQAQEEYDLVAEAECALRDPNVMPPPLLPSSSDSNEDVSTRQKQHALFLWNRDYMPDTDDDEWLLLPFDEWTLEHVIQAEQVVSMLLRVYDWTRSASIVKSVPRLVALVEPLIQHESLHHLLNDITGSAQILRVRSITDPRGRSSYQFQLNDDKYPALRVLRSKLNNLRQQSNSNNNKSINNINKPSKDVSHDIAMLEEDLLLKEQEIERGLISRIGQHLALIDQGLHAVARLDVLFAKAAFGVALNGVIPVVGSEGHISVKGFVHPLLALVKPTSPELMAGSAIPIDLYLPAKPNERALIISGPNGGGKTLALKSFGLVAVLCKLGIPIPVASTTNGERSAESRSLRPRVDFIHHILCAVGDRQDVGRGQSTYTAQLCTYATLLHHARHLSSLSTSSALNESTLILVDEMGSGTEAKAGGAIGQAVLEEFLQLGNPSCRLVATTHSERLKALSFDSANRSVGCAAVLLSGNPMKTATTTTSMTTTKNRPTYRLQYGIIGESHALAAAATQSTPPLPERVLVRASQLLMNGNGNKVDGRTALLDDNNNDDDDEEQWYLHALYQSLQQQMDMATQERLDTEEVAKQITDCRDAMLSLARAYDRHLSYLQNRVEVCYQSLQQDASKNTLEIVGDSLAELRTVRKKIQTEEDLLREKGLIKVPVNYKLVLGEQVVIVSKDEWDGCVGEVVRTLNDDVCVSVSSTPVAWGITATTATASMTNVSPTLVATGTTAASSSNYLDLKRHELAIWDYPISSNTRSATNQVPHDSLAVTSVPDATRRLNDLLCKIGTSTSTKLSNNDRTNNKGKFLSSRQRKAANKDKSKPPRR